MQVKRYSWQRRSWWLMVTMILQLAMFRPEASEEESTGASNATGFKWTNIGLCPYCTKKQDCCRIVRFAVEENYLDNKFYASDYLECGYHNFTASMDQGDFERRVAWCKDTCRWCYEDPKSNMVMYSAISNYFDDTSPYGIVYLLIPTLTVTMLVALYALQWASVRYSSMRRFAILPVLQPVIEFYIAIYVSLFVGLFVTTATKKYATPEYAVCCTQTSSFKLIAVSFFFYFDMFVPMLLFIQPSYTKAAFCETLKEAVLVSAGFPVCFAVIVTVPLISFDATLDDTDHFATFIRLIMAFYFAFMIGYVIFRIILTKRHGEKRWRCRFQWSAISTAKNKGIGFCTYVGSFFLFLLVYCVLLFNELTFESSYLASAWLIVRIPIIYFVLLQETRFWRGGVRGKTDETTMSFDVIDEIQEFLSFNRKILMDYLQIEFGGVIGEGATAIVYSGRLRRTKNKMPVAVKIYTPEEITVPLLKEFAREVQIMREVEHPHVAKILGLSVMPPNIAVVLPLYTGGSLKEFLQRQIGLVKLRNCSNSSTGNSSWWSLHVSSGVDVDCVGSSERY
eukprot:g3381.t1